MTFKPAAQENQAAKTQAGPSTSESSLGHWPVQIRLLSPQAPVLQGARLLIAADCVPVAYPDFHRDLLAGHAVAIGCPKFDDLEETVERIAAIIGGNKLQEITVARMSVPCCAGISRAVAEACSRTGSTVPVREVVIEPNGTKSER